MSTSQRPKRKDIAVEKFDCPFCGAKASEPCTDKTHTYRYKRPLKRPHPERMDEARKAGY